MADDLMPAAGFGRDLSRYHPRRDRDSVVPPAPRRCENWGESQKNPFAEFSWLRIAGASIASKRLKSLGGRVPIVLFLVVFLHFFDAAVCFDEENVIAGAEDVEHSDTAGAVNVL